MAWPLTSFTNFLGQLSGLKQGKFDLSSTSCQRTVIDAINLVFLSLFYLLLILLAVSRGGGSNLNHISRRSWQYWFHLAAFIFSALLSIAYFTLGSWGLTAGESETSVTNWQLCMFRGVVWLSLAISTLMTRKSKWVKTLVSVWWVCFFVLVSVLEVELFVRRDLQILDIVQWPVNFLLSVCGVKLMLSQVSGSDQSAATTLEESLLPEAKTDDQTADHPAEESKNNSFLSSLSFSWLNPLLWKGYLKPLVLEDIPGLFCEDEANVAYKKFSEAWDPLSKEEEYLRNNGKNLVIRVLAKIYLKEMLFVGIVAFARTITVVVSPLLLFAFVTYSNDKEQNLYHGLILLGCLTLSKVVESLSQRQWTFYARRSGLRIRSALMVAVYNKQLRLSSLGKKMHSTGEIVNYIMVDAYRMGEFGWYFHSAWTLPLQLIMSLGVLIGVVGLGALPALVPLFVCGVLNLPFAKRLQDCQAKSMAAQDKRLRSTSEILNSMKIVKLQSWEDHFLRLIFSLRDTEFKWLRDAQHNIANCTALFWLSPTIISSFAFWGCSLFSSAPLDAVTMFTVLATLAIVAEPVVMLPNVFSSIIQVMVSFDRINKFLLEDELKVDAAIERNGAVVHDHETQLQIEAGNFSWDADSKMLTLSSINLEVKRREKVAVCGPVGAGKSSLLYAIIGEIPIISGKVEVCASVAYVSQGAWIQSGTVRDNILYGKPMDKDRYDKAIKACALDKDIKNFVQGDLTEIGQRGINLSGGQKQRVQLARAVYSDADLYLLDDPFSAVDAHTAATLFNDCIMGALAKKTVVLVTHQVEFLPLVDKILVMENGKITQSGSYEDLLMFGTAFEQLVSAHKKSVTQLGTSCQERNAEIQGEGTDHQMVFTDPCEKERGEVSMNGASGQLTEEEQIEVGDVGWKPYLDYFTVPKSATVLCLSIVSQCAFVAFQAASRYWLAFAIAIPQINTGILIGVYAGLSTLGIVFVHLRSLFTVSFGLKASRAFFEGFMNSVFRAPMLFFDSTPVGRILTRASSDLSILDFDIPFGISYVVAGVTELLGIIIVMSLVTWQVLIVGAFTLVAGKYFQNRYLASAREIMRLNGTTKAPIMNYASETAQGVITIRAFKKVDQFFEQYLKLVDVDAKLFFYSNAAMEWLLLRIEALQNITLFVAAFLLIILPQGYIQPGFVGLSLSYALALKGSHVFMTQFYCQISNHIISVERIKQFMHIEPEPEAIVEGNRPPSSWPSKGRIELQGLQIKYQPNAPLVLKGITCTFKEGTRVGVVGRTGSGKTTLISALFRLVEPHSGRICIDGLDICSIGLKDLRTKISIIPQEPTLFRGSIRSNLDPIGLYSDAEIWEVLEKCQLKHIIRGLEKQLDSSVGDEGENWSMGQRQLFCLGRVLLKGNKILVLDEATASIDSATDAILQKIIREEFSDCTVITVAHRIPTVIDSDMVMVLSYGELVEYDEPSELMQRNSAFAKLVAEYWSSCKRSSSQSFENGY